MKTFKLVLGIAFLGFLAQAQPPNRIIYVTSDPSGACTTGSALQWNPTSGNLTGCKGGTWATIATAGVGSVLTFTGDGVLITNVASSGAVTVTLGKAIPTGVIVGTTDTQVLTNKTVDGVSPTTFGFVDPTSSVQTQLNAKAPLVSPTFTGVPAAPTAASTDNSTTLATTAYVTTGITNAIAGVNPAVAVQACTTSSGNTSGFTYNNGVAGIGAFFTGSVNTAVVIDGFTFTALGQRLLVKNDTQSPSGAFNGVYYVTQLQTGILAPILTRALDYDAPSDINNTGSIPCVNGTVNALTSWLLTSTVNTVGTDPLTYSQFSASPGTGPVTIGTTPISGGTTTRILYDNAGVAGEYVISGTGSVCMTTSCTMVTPALGVPTALDCSNCINIPVSNAKTGSVTPGKNGGGKVLVEEHTVSGVANSDFNACITGTYDDYLIELINLIPASGTPNVLLTMSTNGGSSFLSTNYGWVLSWTSDQGGADHQQNPSDSSIRINENYADTTVANGGVSGSIQLFNPANSTAGKYVSYRGVNFNGSDHHFYIFYGGAQQSSTTAVNSFRIAFSGVNFSGTIRCYGLAN